MVADIVLLKELPDFLKESIEAYVGCVAGAMIEEDYLETIKSAGFEHVKIADKMSFPAEYMANDPVAKAIIENFKIPSKKAKKAVKEFLSSVLSIKIHGVKPADRL
jgi:hypothetical protein